jgi:hypothetical protein
MAKKRRVPKIPPKLFLIAWAKSSKQPNWLTFIDAINLELRHHLDGHELSGQSIRRRLNHCKTSLDKQGQYEMPNIPVDESKSTKSLVDELNTESVEFWINMGLKPKAVEKRKKR